ncbi:MAG: 50S ribosomal protein L11 methyltransferase [Flavobacteriales bacterium]
MDYIEVEFILQPLLPAREVLVYELSERNFDTFEDTKTGVKAYIPKDIFSPNLLEELQTYSIDGLDYSFETREIPTQNWNAEWEKDFHPIYVNEQCTIKAPFHQTEAKPYDVVISPKMSFGTGHHETTFLMASELFELQLTDKKVLDMGAGTGILAILASKLGAITIDAIDIEDWICENAEENKQLNNTPNITIEKGSVELLRNRLYNVILANINRNILAEHMQTYALCLEKEGILLLSGFFTSDADILIREAEKWSLAEELRKQKNDWCMLKLKKINL